MELANSPGRSYKNPNNSLVCGKKFSTDNLKKHFISVHENQKPHKCSICDYSCSRRSTLEMHVESVHGNQNSINAHCVITPAHKRVT